MEHMSHDGRYHRRTLEGQIKAPLFEGLLEHVRQEPLAFHIPGHKSGRGMDALFRDTIGKQALALDLINIAPLDDLHAPHGMIREAERLAAEAFAAEHAFFSVQGTSTAIMAMILATTGPGEKIIVPRNVHKSVLSAIIFAGALPIFIYPEMDRTFGISHGISYASLERALMLHPDARAVLLINPTYFGVACQLPAYVDLVHAYGIPVLVDEAHGAHLYFHPELPPSAMEAGADVAAVSMHKLGGSMTQSSLLLQQGNRVSHQRLQAMMSMLQTTSTSYLLLSSLDTARRHMATRGEELLSQTIALSRRLRQAVRDIPGLAILDETVLAYDSFHALDPTKITIQVAGLGISGYEAEQYLREHARIEVELSDLYNILVLITPGDDDTTINRLIEALYDLSATFQTNGAYAPADILLPDMPALALSPRDAFYAEVERIPLSESAGRVMAEFIMVYPPGIPILMPGEIITQDNIDYIEANVAQGLPVQGPEDATLATIKVIKERLPLR